MATHPWFRRGTQALALVVIVLASRGYCQTHDAKRASLLIQTSPAQAVTAGAGIEEALTRLGETAADPNSLQRGASLATQLQAMVPSEAVAAILRAAVATHDPAGRTRVAGVLRLLLHQSRPKDGRPASFNVGALDPRAWSAEWKALITDDRVSGTDSPMTIADQYLSLNEQLFVDRMTDRPRKCIDDYGEQGRDLIRRRVLGRLSGMSDSQLPEYPGESTLSPAASARLRQKLGAVTSYKEMATLVQGLSLDERAGLPTIMQADPDLSVRLIPIANTVVAVVADDADAAMKERLATWVGETVTPGMVADLREYCIGQCGAGRRFICLLARDKHLGGCCVKVKEEDPRGQNDRVWVARPTAVYALVCAGDLRQDELACHSVLQSARMAGRGDVQLR